MSRHFHTVKVLEARAARHTSRKAMAAPRPRCITRSHTPHTVGHSTTDRSLKQLRARASSFEKLQVTAPPHMPQLKRHTVSADGTRHTRDTAPAFDKTSASDRQELVCSVVHT